MGIAGPGLLIIGLVVHLIGWIMLIVVAWRESIWWGLLSIFVPFVALIFVITHWQDAKRPFLISISGTAVFVLGAMVTPTTPKAKPVEEKPVPVAEKHVLYNSSDYVAPAPKPRPVPQPQEEPAQPVFVKVYVDTATHLYYPTDCATRPENSYLIAKSVAVRQGYKPGKCS